MDLVRYERLATLKYQRMSDILTSGTAQKSVS